MWGESANRCKCVICSVRFAQVYLRLQTRRPGRVPGPVFPSLSLDGQLRLHGKISLVFLQIRISSQPIVCRQSIVMDLWALLISGNACQL